MTMAMPRASKPDLEPMMEMNMTPLIDVMLVLIIMMIITIPRANHSIDLSMPQASNNAPKEKPEVFKVDIGADGAVLWNGVLVATRAELFEKLAKVGMMSTPNSLQVHAHKAAAYKSVAAVMAMAQRAHIKNMGMAGNR